MALTDKALLIADAKNRSLRTFVQGVGIDVAVAVAALVLSSVDAITDKQGLIVFFVALGKTVVTSVASYVMRAFLDKSGMPTPLPPSPAVEPADDLPVA